MNTYYLIFRSKTDNSISSLAKRKLDKTKEEILIAIEKQNSDPNFLQSVELVDDQKSIELMNYALKLESNSDLDDVLNMLNDIESTINKYIREVREK